MPCFSPIPAARDGREVRLHPSKSGESLSLPCGNCIGCKIMRGQEWASRCVHELREHHSAVFATLTYDDEHLPVAGSLLPDDLRDFLKRLRVEVEREKRWIVVNPPELFYHKRLRYLACGEYGDVKGRPHYHAILFGVSFADSRRCSVSKSGDDLYESPELTATWGFGSVSYGAVTRASAAYVAGYTAKSFGKSYCDADGVVLEPPFLRVSKGLGQRYCDRYAEDFRSGALVVDGVPQKLPRYYRKRLAERRPDVMQDADFALQTRERSFGAHWPERLVAGEVIAKRKRQLTRRHSL